MDVFEYAMNMEIEGEKIYRTLANKNNDVGLKVIFEMLADMEKEHYRVFSEMRTNNFKQAERPDILPDILKVLKWMKNRMEKITLDTPQLEIYRQAMESEKEAQVFYSEKANESNDPMTKTALLQIAEEEHRHFEILEEIIGALSPDGMDIEDGGWSRMPS